MGARITAAFVVVAVAAVAACSDDDRDDIPAQPSAEQEDEPELELAEPAVDAPPAAPAPTTHIGAGPSPQVPTRVPLRLAEGVERPDPPMRVQKLWPLGTRALAIAHGVTAEGPVAQLIDIDNATIQWIDREHCVHPIVHTTDDRAVCAGWKEIVAIDVDGGDGARPVWSSELMFRAAGAGVVFARDAENPRLGTVYDVGTGRVVAELEAPENDSFDQVEAVCASGERIDLYAWSPEGEMRRFRGNAGRSRRPRVDRVWSRRFRMPPSKVDPCDELMLVEIPIPGSVVRELQPVYRKNGRDAAPAVKAYGWWKARTGDGIETLTDEGWQVRPRSLARPKAIAATRLGGRLVASWGETRLVRSVAGTLMLLDGDGVRDWLAGPAYVDRAVMTSRHILAGSWLAPPQSHAERLTLFAIPERRLAEKGTGAVPRLPKPAAAEQPAPLVKVPAPTKVTGKAIALDGVGMHAVGEVVLDGARLYAEALEARPGPGRSAGLAAFDLAAKKWLWNRDNLCAENADVVGLAVAGEVVVCATRAHYPRPGVVVAVAADTGEPRWRRELDTVDRVAAAGDAVVVDHGSRATVLDAASGEVAFSLEADNRHLPRAVPVALDSGEARVVAVEHGDLVARDASGAPQWSVGVRGYVASLERVEGGVLARLSSGEVFHVAAGDGTATPLGDDGAHVAPGGDLLLSIERRDASLVVAARGPDGAPRFRATYAIGSAGVAQARGPGAPLVLVGRGAGAITARPVDPATGAVATTYALPARTVFHAVFSARVGDRAIVGTLTRKPLAVQIF